MASRPEASANSPSSTPCQRQVQLRAASSLQPPASSLQPPASSLQPPASSLQPPASSLGQPRPASASLGQPRPASASCQVALAGRPYTGLVFDHAGSTRWQTGQQSLCSTWRARLADPSPSPNPSPNPNPNPHSNPNPNPDPNPDPNPNPHPNPHSNPHQEYAKSVALDGLRAPVVTAAFPGPPVYAKTARGQLARYCAVNCVSSAAQLREFRGSGGEWSF
eukprot:scaffold18244_cov58-Phaeocystis_antarctica.AAC.3